MTGLYVYHAVPKDMIGTTLFPLNRLQERLPEAYASAVKKYEWRQSILQTTIPKLDCLWNDVLHFSPVDPRILYKTLERVNPRLCAERKFYVIPLKTILTKRCALYQSPVPELDPAIYSTTNQAPSFVIRPESVEPITKEVLPDFACKIPETTVDYFKFEVAHGRRPLVFNGICHVLALGEVEISDCKVIDWSGA